MMLGFLLARSGIDVVVLEKHADFLRDFRGDTIHPSTLDVINELGLLEDFLARPHQRVTHLDAYIEDQKIGIGDFTHLPTKCKFLALMPQWDFLNFLAKHAAGYPSFHLQMRTEATDLIFQGDRIVGARAKTPKSALEIRAGLVIGADGRGSILRDRAGLEIIDRGAPMDVLWMRILKNAGDPSQALGRISAGKILVMIDREDYWQCAYVIAKGGFAEIQNLGLPAFREQIKKSAPFLGNRVEELKSWDDVKMLTVRVDHLRRWHRDGLLFIGDAAHAMSPIGGVGINLAIQDAVAAANILTEPLRRGVVAERDLQKVQKRRELPTRLTQKVQVYIQNHAISKVLARKSDQRMKPALVFRLLRRWPMLRRIPARIVGMGFRPEHVKFLAPNNDPQIAQINAD